MFDRRQTLGLLAVAAGMLVPLPAVAMSTVAFEPNAFRAAQEAGKPLLIHVTAIWCQTCEAQKAVLARLAHDPALGAFTVFVVDYDDQKEVMRGFGVRMRSTLIVFKGKSELGRLQGDTREDSIMSLLQKAL